MDCPACLINIQDLTHANYTCCISFTVTNENISFKLSIENFEFGQEQSLQQRHQFVDYYRTLTGC